MPVKFIQLLVLMTASVLAMADSTPTDSTKSQPNGNSHQESQSRVARPDSKNFILLIDQFLSGQDQRLLKGLNTPQMLGPESGGGGGGYLLQDGQVVLFDLYYIPSGRLVPQAFMAAPSRVNETRSTKTFTFLDDEKTNSAFQVAHTLVKSWSDLPWSLASLHFEIALSDPFLSWTFTDEILPELDFYLPEGKTELTSVRAAYYNHNIHDKKALVKISKPVWNTMDLRNQVALLIHEILRHVQLKLKKGFDDRVLQQVTALMLTCKPRVQLDLYLLAGMTKDSTEMLQKFGDFNSLITDCEALK